MEMLRNLIDEVPQDVDLSKAINEAVKTLGLTKAGGKLAGAGVKQFLTRNRGLTIAAGAMALNAFSKYKQNKRNTIRLFAKDAYEKKMMTDITDALTGTGRFRILQTKYADGGKMWILKRIR